MSKIPVNIKLELTLWQEIEMARGDINRTRFFELLLDRNEKSHAAAWVALDRARGLETTPVAAPQEPVQPVEQAVALPPTDTPARPVKPAPKRRTKKQPLEQTPEPEVEEEEAPTMTPKRPPRMRPVLTGRLKT